MAARASSAISQGGYRYTTIAMSLLAIRPWRMISWYRMDTMMSSLSPLLTIMRAFRITFSLRLPGSC